MSDLRKRFGRLVAAHRRRKGMTQDELATAADLSVDMISKIEVGANGARFPVIERLAAALEVDPAELFLAQGYNGPVRQGPFSEITSRLVQMPDADLHWLKGVLDAILRPRL